MIKFDYKVYDKNIAVEDQNLVVKFAHVNTVNGVWTNVTDFSECRDFMGDALYADHTKKNLKIYGFTCEPLVRTLAKSSVCIGIEFPSQDVMDIFLKNYPVMMPVEDVFKDKGVILFPDKLIAVIKFKALWKKSIFGISYLTFLLKSLCYTLDSNKDLMTQIKESTWINEDSWNGEKVELPTKEARYARDCFKELQKLPAIIEQIMKKQTTVHGIDDDDPYNVHHNTGFYSTFKWKKTEPYNLFTK